MASAELKQSMGRVGTFALIYRLPFDALSIFSEAFLRTGCMYWSVLQHKHCYLASSLHLSYPQPTSKMALSAARDSGGRGSLEGRGVGTSM